MLSLCVLYVLQNQFFISGLSGDEIIHNRVLDALYRRIMRAFNDKKCFRVIIVLPLLPGFQVLVFIQLTYIKVLYGSYMILTLVFDRGEWMMLVQHLYAQ